ncbi:MAG: hypothetical protein OEZ02_02555 [Anaerolineae bacterium]|nr:hypothetical protein [Anaerolineae bacterium]
MIIHQPEINQKDGKVILSAHIETQSPSNRFPENLRFEFPEQLAAHVSTQSNAFAACMALYAMVLGEDLHVHGSTSPKLAYGLQEIIRIFNIWEPQLLTPIEITYQNFATLPAVTPPSAVATAFSGGLDSFFTLWEHLPDQQLIPSARITHGLFVDGLDFLPENNLNYPANYQTYSAIFKSLGLELFSAFTNLRSLTYRRILWRYLHGAGTLAPALALGNFFGRFYLPATNNYHALTRWSTSPVIDHHFSTETLEIVHHGAAATRIEKLAALAHWPPVQQHLRVCLQTPASPMLNNCSHCEKCLRTMSMLEILSAYDHFTCFHAPMTKAKIFRWAYSINPDRYDDKETVLYAAAHGRQDLARLIRLGALIGRSKTWLSQNTPVWLKHPFKKLLVPGYKKTLSEAKHAAYYKTGG